MPRPPSPEPADLPDGIVRLPPEPVDEPPPPGGCGFTGCAYTLVGFFALLLVIMVVILLFRVWPTPVVLPR